MFGTDMTIGADTALHRITEAVDAIHSTAASHQRTFVIEVMGRNCGYLALMTALATGANWVLIPEHPPEAEDWEEAMCDSLRAGREIGRRQNIVVLAEGAQDRNGKPITAQYVRDVLEDRLGEDTRITILGHVQRGGSPSAFDRYMSTQLGAAAVDELLRLRPDQEAKLVGLREHEIVSSPLMSCIEKTHAVASHIGRQDYDRAMEMRGGNFADSVATFNTLTRAQPRERDSGEPLRFMILHAGGPAPGMNTAARVAVRIAADRGHTTLAALKGFEGLRDGRVEELDWMSVSGWVAKGGAELGTSRWKPDRDDYERLAFTLESSRVDGLLVIGGFTAYEVAHGLHQAADEHPAFDIPIVCLPATINNDVPGSELSIGSDTALNAIVADVDKIKQSAVASRRCFVVEVMGNECGYLALLSGLSTGAERVYLPEEGITLDSLRQDIEHLSEGFRRGKRLGLVIRGEHADPTYTTAFVHALYDKEGGDLYDVRDAVLGHVQQGGSPSPFDRIQATRLATRCVEFLEEQAGRRTPASAFIGLQKGKVAFTDLGRFWELVEDDARRPREQRWMAMRDLARVMSAFPAE
jgi:6-phosphofructokinase 1